MSTAEVLLVIGLLIPLVGNLVAFALRKGGKFEAADVVDQLTPIAARAGVPRSREQAISLALELLRAVGDELGPEHPFTAEADQVRKELRPEPKVPPAVPPLMLLGLFAIVVGCVPILGCTPAQRQDAKAIGVPIAQVAGGVCEQISGVMRDDVGGAFVEFACTVVRAAGSVLGNLGTTGGVAVDRPDGPPVRVVVRVYLEGGRTEVQP